MAAAAANRAAYRKDSDEARRPVAANVRLFKDTMVFYNAGNLIPARTGGSGDSFAGVVMSEHNNTGGAAGAITAIVRRTGAFAFGFVGTVTSALNGVPLYAADDQTVTTVSTGAQLVGYGSYDPAKAAMGLIFVNIERAVN